MGHSCQISLPLTVVDTHATFVSVPAPKILYIERNLSHFSKIDEEPTISTQTNTRIFCGIVCEMTDDSEWMDPCKNLSSRNFTSVSTGRPTVSNSEFELVKLKPAFVPK